MIEEIKKEFQRKVAGYIAAAFGLVAGLAWNEAIKALIEYLFPLNHDSLIAKFAYAVLITVILVVVTGQILRINEGKEKEEKQD